MVGESGFEPENRFPGTCKSVSRRPNFQESHIGALLRFWRRGRDSNPRPSDFRLMLSRSTTPAMRVCAPLDSLNRRKPYRWISSDSPTYVAGGRGVTPVFACISAQSTSKLLSRAYRWTELLRKMESNHLHQVLKTCALPSELFRVRPPVARETFAALHNFRATIEKITW